jgi:hypothetical protein
LLTMVILEPFVLSVDEFQFGIIGIRKGVLMMNESEVLSARA